MEDKKILDAVRLIKEHCVGSGCSECILSYNGKPCTLMRKIPYRWDNSTIKPKLTAEEKIILRNIDDEYKWIARDKDGELYFYKGKPTKRIVIWNTNNYSLGGIFSHLFQFVTWEDDEPYCILDLLEDIQQ